MANKTAKEIIKEINRAGKEKERMKSLKGSLRKKLKKEVQI